MNETQLDELKSLLIGTKLFTGLKDEELEALAPLLRKTKAYKEQEVVEVDEPGESLYLVAEGRFKVILLGENGREVILSMLRAGDFFGELSLIDGKPRSATVISMQKSLLYGLHRDDFYKFMKSHPHAWLSVVQAISSRLRRAVTVIGDLTLLDIHQRIARYLIELAGKDGIPIKDDLMISKPPPQADIASMLGVTRETISRTISDLVRKKLLQKQGRSILLTRSFLDKYSI